MFHRSAFSSPGRSLSRNQPNPYTPPTPTQLTLLRSHFSRVGILPGSIPSERQVAHVTQLMKTEQARHSYGGALYNVDPWLQHAWTELYVLRAWANLPVEPRVGQEEVEMRDRCLGRSASKKVREWWGKFGGGRRESWPRDREVEMRDVEAEIEGEFEGWKFSFSDEVEMLDVDSSLEEEDTEQHELERMDTSE